LAIKLAELNYQASVKHALKKEFAFSNLQPGDRISQKDVVDLGKAEQKLFNPLLVSGKRRLRKKR
jgi:hypothetical protein